MKTKHKKLIFQSDVYSIVAHNAPKCKQYRSQLEPWVGKRVTITGRYIEDDKRWCGRQIGYVKMILLKNVHILGKSAYTHHMWLHITKNIQHAKLRQGRSVECTGILYEYEHGGKRNIELRVEKIRNIKKFYDKEKIAYGK